jgi:cysteine synthase A
MMQALGAEVILVDQLPGSVSGRVSGGDLELVATKADQVTRERNAFRADQFRLHSNFRAHFFQTGPEFLEQADGQIDAFCDFVGTGGTFAGCSAAFKQYNPAIHCYIIEPEGAAVLAGNPVTEPNHPIQGGGYSIPDLPLINPGHVDGYLQVSVSEAVDCTRQLARQEGIFAGFSSGANLAAALQLLNGHFSGKTVAIVICDSGLKYLSTGLWSPEDAREI